MRLYEHSDFQTAILAAEEYFREQGLRAAIIEKDYYVTEVLRIVANTVGERAIFKGGTSLSKGWNLINRFSEDIDLFLDPAASEPVWGRNRIDREMKTLCNAVKAHPALTYLSHESQTIGGFGRCDRFAYKQQFGGPGDVPGRVLLEAGTASGKQPTEDRELRSLLAQFLKETGQTLETEDEAGFIFRLLHFRRTFVEKLFAIHSAVERLKQHGSPIGTQVRHYYDLYQLAGTPEVLEMLASKEYEDIRADYDRISRIAFGRDYLPPKNLRFNASIALFPKAELVAIIGPEYERQCELLCYTPAPSWADVEARLGELRTLL